eukprot:Plantae.Rhodophyta-Purpureofilum_apyrenoidigerum.ctg19964.p1 GENE.Plantae.Rhodophyta-Purpureofilum_apyrenoidigerum.ctg19964~~Plantae.Rhodophyta-Purpureofilum_apyrenoidigerum.ctg19964.p1  ORF type:complete len:245 (-),score=43.30 Plantae.Rhodophyta-Purpureofilum_apyrenoidigerum.ctg19964:698-1432(-)
MEHFTQMVDATLWSSRAYDDGEYEADALAGELSASKFEFSGDAKAAAKLTTLLVCTEGSPCLFARAALDLGVAIGELSSTLMERIEIYRAGDAAVVALESNVASERSYQLSLALFELLPVEKVVVATSLPAWRVQAQTELSDLFFLATSRQPTDNISELARAGKLPAPSLLEGLAAAVLTEAQLSGKSGAVLIGVDDSIRLSGLSLARFAEPVKKLTPVPVNVSVDFSRAVDSLGSTDKEGIYL